MSDSIQLQSIMGALGQPTSLDQDPRKGVTAIWGSRKTGAFTVFRGPVDTTYEVVLLPADGSSFAFASTTLTASELNDYVQQSIFTIKSVLAGL